MTALVMKATLSAGGYERQRAAQNLCLGIWEDVGSSS